LGVASVNLGYGGEDDGGIYHSIYDDFYWFTHFSDTDFGYGRALAQTVGTLVMRLSEAELLPFEFTALADTLRKYADEVEGLLKKKQEDTRDRNRDLEDGVYKLTLDPRRPTLPPKAEEMPPHLNFAPLRNAVEAVARSAERYDKARAKADLASPRLLAVNRKLIESERRLLDPDGLPGRPWFRHVLYAPGVYTGYEAKTMPGVRESIEQRKWAQAEAEIAKVARALVAEAAVVAEAAEELERAAR
jgi:N-acetylated-alpha-linked acidic dipeptidase